MFKLQIKQDFNQNAIFLIVVLAVTYNALLSFINSHLFGVSFAMVAITEFLILISAIIIILKMGLTRFDSIDIFLILMGVTSAFVISIINQTVFIDSIRNILIIALFVMLGRRIDQKNLQQIFWIVSLIIAFFLILEIADLAAFAKLLNPASYYAATRGMEVSEFNDTGLFNTAAGFEGRFGYGIFNGPRTSSIFLEQVSLSNFAIILGIYLAVFWQKIKNHKRIFFILLIITILVTARSRSALALTIFALLTYHLLPLIPKKVNLLIFPVILLLIAIVYLTNLPYTYDDTFKGRISLTGHLLASFDLGNLFSLEIDKLKRYADSGIPYTITSYTIFGAILLWLYFVMVIFNDGPEQRRFVTLSNLYLFTLLMVGAAVFTIKTAALLWILAGYLSTNSKQVTQRVNE